MSWKEGEWKALVASPYARCHRPSGKALSQHPLLSTDVGGPTTAGLACGPTALCTFSSACSPS